MPTLDPKYNSLYTGQQLDTAISKALPFDQFTNSSVTISNVTYNVLWKVLPASNNTVYGIAVNPSTGKFCIIKSENNIKTVEEAVSGSLSISTAADHDHTVSLSANKVVTDINPTSTNFDWSLNTTNNTVDAVTGYPGSTSKLVTTSVKGVSDSTTTASYATAGANITVAKRAASQTTVGNADVGTEITGVAKRADSQTTVGNANKATTQTTVGDGSISVTKPGANNTQVATSAYEASYDSANCRLVLTPLTITGGTTNIYEATTSTTKIYGCASDTVSFKPATEVTDNSTKIYGCDSTTETITPYTFEDVTVPIADTDSTTVATGTLNANGAGSSVMTGLGTANTATVLKSTTTISVTNPDSGGTALLTSITADKDAVTNAGTTSSAGGHSHTIE